MSHLSKSVTLMNQVSQLALQEQPPDTYFDRLRDFFKHHEPPVDKYYLYKDDLVSLKPGGDTADMDTHFMTFLLECSVSLLQVSTSLQFRRESRFFKLI